MDQQRLVLRVGAGAILCAVALRLGSGLFSPMAEVFSQPEAASLLLYLETGRILRPVPEPVTDASTPTEIQEEPSQTLPSFTVEEAAQLSIRYNCAYEPDIAALLTKPLDWELTGEEPTVLILHTHATESYTPAAGEEYEQSSAFRTLDEGYNMVSIGEEVTRLLENNGISVIHDTTYHDYPSYSGSYAAARDTIAGYLETYPGIRLILDLHRDAAETADGSQMTTAATFGSRDSAQLMLVLGSDAGGLTHPNWQENLSLGLKLQAILERENPGICRSMNFCDSRYNQDLLPGALLVEVGAAGNTHAEALAAAEALAQAILTLSHGTR